MKVASKFLFWVLLINTSVVGLFGLLSYNREQVQFQEGMKIDLGTLGHIVAISFEDVWRKEGRIPALALLQDINNRQSKALVKFVRPDSLSEEHLAGQQAQTSERGRIFRRYFPITLPDNQPAAIEISQSLEPFYQYSRQSLYWIAALAFVLWVCSSIVIIAAGYGILGKPLSRLAMLAHEIGDSHFVQDPSLEGQDEMGKLAFELNQMSRRLEDTIEDLMKKNEANLALQEELRHQERLGLLGTIAAGISHELGTPLNVISSRAKLISRGRLSEEDAQNSCEIIHEQADRMSSIIRQFLHLGRRSPVKATDINLGDLANHVVEILSDVAQQHNVTLVVSYPKDLPCVSADRSQLQHVLLNIIVNAIHASPPDGKVQVELSAGDKSTEGHDGQWLTCSVIDDGDGISEEIADRIFDPFFSTKPSDKGTGLGLSIAQEIIHDHSGWISVQSPRTTGACISFHLPMGG